MSAPAAPPPADTAPAEVPVPPRPFPGPPAKHGYLGLSIERVTQEDAARFGWKAPRGVKVTGRAPESPVAGLILHGDIILAFDGQEIVNQHKFVAAVNRTPAGTIVHLLVAKESGKEEDVTLTLAARPERQDAGSPVHLMLDTGGHMARISGVAVTPDGRQAVTASNDKTIRVWDIEKGELVRVIRGETGLGETGSLYAMALSPDGRWLAAGGYLHSSDLYLASAIRLYDFATGKLVALLQGHEQTVRSLAFSPDSRKLVSGANDFTAIVWDVSGRRALRRLSGHEGPVLSTAFSADGARVFTGSEDETLRTWNANDGVRIGTMTEHRSQTLPKPGEQKRWRGHVTALAVSPAGDVIASGSEDGRILLSDAATGMFLRQLAFPGGALGRSVVDGASFSPDGRWLNTTSIMEGCLIFETATGAELFEGKLHPSGLGWLSGATHERCYGHAAFTPDGKFIATSFNNKLLIVDAATSKAVKTLGGASETIYAAGFSPDSRTIAWGFDTAKDSKTPATLTGSFRLPFDGAPLAGVEPVDAGAPDNFVRGSSSNGGKSLKYQPAGPYASNIRVVEIAEDGHWTSQFERSNPTSYDPLVFTPDGAEVLSIDGSTTIEAHDLHGRETGSFTGHEGQIRALAPSPDGRYLLSGGSDKTLRLWNLKTRELIVTLYPGKDGEWAMWTPEGYYASSPGGDSVIGWQINRGPESEPGYVTSGQIRKHLNRPDIVARAIELASPAKAIAEANGATFKIEELMAKPVPKIRILSPLPGARVSGGKVELEIELEPVPDPVRRLHIQVNGVQIAEELPTEGQGFAPGTHKVKLPLARGRNAIHIAAINNTGETPANLVLNHDGEGLLDKRGTLYVVAIGVDKYPNFPNGDLSYSGADATAFADAMVEKAGPLHQAIVKRVLVNGGAPETAPTKANIEDALGVLASATENDTVMVFVAGHGMNDGPSYRFLPTDAAAAGGGRLVPSSVVPWYAFQEAIETAKGRRILFLDTCHSANAYNPVLSNQAYHANILVYAASRWDQTAQERDNLGSGHGLFTYSVIEGVRGGARNPEGEVRTDGLHAFVAQRVAKLAEEQGKVQTPQFFQGRDAQDYVLSRDGAAGR
jgi:WD40 repeat protein